MNKQHDIELEELMGQIRNEIGGDVTAGQSGALSTVEPGRLSVAEIMRRVRKEVARRRGGADDESVGTPVGEIAFPRWHPIPERLATKEQYTLGELLAFSDSGFIQAVYQAVLRRAADSMGLRHFLSLLRTGQASKVEIIGDIRWSPEGMARGVHVDGLLIPYKLAKWKRKRFVGPVLRWVHAFVRMGAVPERQAASAAGQAYEIQSMGETLNELSSALDQKQAELPGQIANHLAAVGLDSVKRQFESISQRIEEIVGRIEAIDQQLEADIEVARLYEQSLEALSELRKQNAGLERRQEELEAQLEHLMDGHLAGQAAISSANREALALQQRINHLERSIAEQSSPRPVDMLGSEISALSDRLRGVVSIEHRLAALQGRPTTELDDRAEHLDLDPLYAAFEDRFRGDRALVRRRAEPYLDLVRDVGAGTSMLPVLDIGCGRGEWLELLRDHGLVGRGIDLNRVFADICRGYGLDIIEGDAIKALSAMPSNSVGAITSMHLVEHLAFEQVVVMLDEALRVLVPGGIIVLETPNPENLTVAAHTFYMDPTHRNPLPPEALRWIVGARGFHGARIERLTVARELTPPPLLPDDVPGAHSINTLLASLGVAPDYAIVARKS